MIDNFRCNIPVKLTKLLGVHNSHIVVVWGQRLTRWTRLKVWTPPIKSVQFTASYKMDAADGSKEKGNANATRPLTVVCRWRCGCSATIWRPNRSCASCRAAASAAPTAATCPSPSRRTSTSTSWRPTRRTSSSDSRRYFHANSIAIQCDMVIISFKSTENIDWSNWPVNQKSMEPTRLS